MVQLLLQREASGILHVAAVDHVAERRHASLGLALEPDGADALEIDRGDLLARAQIGDGARARGRRHPIGDAAAGAAMIETEHEARPFRRPAVDEGIDAERPVGADQPRLEPLQIVEAGPPHQRAVAEHP